LGIFIFGNHLTLFYHSPEVKIEESSQKSLKRS
jgi:hypothetical protein